MSPSTTLRTGYGERSRNTGRRPINGLHASTPWLTPLTPFILSVGRAALGVEGSWRTVFFNELLAYWAALISSSSRRAQSYSRKSVTPVATAAWNAASPASLFCCAR